MDWFRQAAAGKPNAAESTPEVAGAGESRGAEVGGLNFKSAVDAHMKWKIRLESYINGTSDEDLKVDVICRDDQCPLGKWIYSRGGSEFGYAETFYDMKVHHAHFHRCAGDVLRTAQDGDKDKALSLLHHGDYVRASERVKKLLAKLFVLVVDGKTAIDSHMKWKERLSDFVAGKGDDLDAGSVGRDDLCPLGAWINGEGSLAHRDKPGFASLREVHTRFHASAGRVVDLVKQGRREEAMAMIEEGEYADASDAVTAALVEVFAKPA
jgi:hypothetical protein